MCSSSSDADRPAKRLLGAALDALGREAPAHRDLLCGTLAALTVNLHVDREALGVRAAAGGLAVAEPAASARVTIRTDLATAYALLDGRLTTLEAVRTGKLDARGSASDLAVAAEALSVFLHGLVRCPSGGALLHDLRIRAYKES